MEDQNKLFVFERKEVILIFVFIVLIAVIAFTLGVRTGKSLSLKADGYTKKDQEMIELKSVAEENVEDIVPMDSTEKEASPLEQDEIDQRIKEEMQKLAEEKVTVDPMTDEAQIDDSQATSNSETGDSSETIGETSNPYAGKYTVQLSAHKTQDSAQEFADAFIIKGYDMIINEANIPGKGKWYRVSIGLFETRQEALSYISEKKDLFQDREYTINKL